MVDVGEVRASQVGVIEVRLFEICSASPAQDITRELERQYGIAESQGIPVEWRVAEPAVTEAAQRVVRQEGYGDRITVMVVPAE